MVAGVRLVLVGDQADLARSGHRQAAVRQHGALQPGEPAVPGRGGSTVHPAGQWLILLVRVVRCVLQRRQQHLQDRGGACALGDRAVSGSRRCGHAPQTLGSGSLINRRRLACVADERAWFRQRVGFGLRPSRGRQGCPGLATLQTYSEKLIRHSCAAIAAHLAVGCVPIPAVVFASAPGRWLGWPLVALHPTAPKGYELPGL